MSNASQDWSASFNISSSVLFHFTNSVENLLSIFQDDFSPRYCPEYGLFDNVLSSKHRFPPSYARPMVCFCDLPLSLIKKHLKQYGSYGIGLNKEWGKKNGVTPILYVHEHSLVWQPIRGLFGLRVAEREGQEDQITHTMELMAYVKPYEGPAWRNGSYVDKVRFYDEREWRYAPLLSLTDGAALGRDDYINEVTRQSANARIAERFRLRFSPDDVEYIILQDDDEILPMIRQLEIIKGKYHPDEVKLLTTAIMTVNRILEDI